MVLAGISGRRADSANSQAIRMTKAGLTNSEGCTLTPATTIQRRAPLISTPSHRVETTSARLMTKTTSAMRRICRGLRKRGGDQHHEGRDQKKHVAVDEVERVEADAGGDRGTGGKRQHDAGEHQGRQRPQHRLVDRPPPGAEARAFHPGHHVQPSVTGATPAETRAPGRETRDPRDLEIRQTGRTTRRPATAAPPARRAVPRSASRGGKRRPRASSVPAITWGTRPSSVCAKSAAASPIR